MKIKHKKDIHFSWPVAAEPQNICSKGQLGEAAKVQSTAILTPIAPIAVLCTLCVYFVIDTTNINGALHLKKP